MYSIYLSVGLALLTGFGWTYLDLWEGWVMGIVIGVITFIATVAIIGRRFGRKIQPVLMQVQKLAEAGKAVLALNAIETLIPISNWIPMLKGQLYAQMGILCLGAKKEDEAIRYLEMASNRSAEAKMFLASMYAKRNKRADAARVLEIARKSNKKHVLLFNVHAWLLMKDKDVDGAIGQLNALLKTVPENENTKDNLKRLQNGSKMSMKGFGMDWYNLGLERPPASMVQSMQQQMRGGYQPHMKRPR